MGKWIAITTLLVTSAGAMLFLFTVSYADDAKKPKRITVEEIRNAEVIGDLGQPLGEIITIEGVIADGTYTNFKSHLGCILLRVDAVNGKKIPKEKIFVLGGNDKPKVGSKFKYIGYETASYTGQPKGVWQYREMFATTGYCFTTEFRVLRNELEQAKGAVQGKIQK